MSFIGVIQYILLRKTFSYHGHGGCLRKPIVRKHCLNIDCLFKMEEHRSFKMRSSYLSAAAYNKDALSHASLQGDVSVHVQEHQVHGITASTS
ncbi:hypothetical protein CEXT_116041 [Caerostris extrusa]|uniref:Uncharacterized protein n=1 Tax=Caerostris extrusa TaxID=172846 RepID=A0AAV4XG53_CAEEX|nr:hypothetical protein CEXT_116041 [Caerostris extrusa]